MLNPIIGLIFLAVITVVGITILIRTKFYL